MTTRIKTYLSSLVLVFAVAFSAAPILTPVAYAACEDGADNTKTSFNWGGAGGCTKTENLISTVFKFLAGIVGVAVVGGIALGGMLYTTSNGNGSKAQQGITTIVNSVIGLLVFIFMFAITNFIVPGGIL